MVGVCVLALPVLDLRLCKFVLAKRSLRERGGDGCLRKHRPYKENFMATLPLVINKAIPEEAGVLPDVAVTEASPTRPGPEGRKGHTGGR